VDLSIVVPSIRTDRWADLLDSIELSCNKYSWEVIFVGPEMDPCVESYRNIKFLRDFGHPNRCQQLGAMIAEGTYIHFGSDDCTYREDVIERVLDVMTEDILVCNYTEGDEAQKSLSLLTAYGQNKFNQVTPEMVYFNVPFFLRSCFMRYGFDCAYETTCWGHSDLALRCQLAGENVQVFDQPIFDCTHMPGMTGDHGPIHVAFHEDQNYWQNNKVDIDTSKNHTWRLASFVWKKRFA
jgi:hypothetical protein